MRVLRSRKPLKEADGEKTSIGGLIGIEPENDFWDGRKKMRIRSEEEINQLPIHFKECHPLKNEINDPVSSGDVQLFRRDSKQIRQALHFFRR
jgi:hypothetical protein